MIRAFAWSLIAVAAGYLGAYALDEPRVNGSRALLTGNVAIVHDLESDSYWWAIPHKSPDIDDSPIVLVTLAPSRKSDVETLLDAYAYDAPVSVLGIVAKRKNGTTYALIIDKIWAGKGQSR